MLWTELCPQPNPYVEALIAYVTLVGTGLLKGDWNGFTPNFPCNKVDFLIFKKHKKKEEKTEKKKVANS